MAITGNMRMTIKVCQLYYEDNLSQKEISAQLGISRPQISRLLTYARTNNIVSVKINNPYIDETRLEHLLVEKYRMKDALVLNTNGAGEAGRLDEFGRLAANYLDAYIMDNNRVGVMSGQTISRVVWSIRHFDRRGLEFVPLVGGIGSASVNFHANVIAQRFAECSGGSSYILNAPVIVQSEESRNILVSEPEIAAVLDKGNSCDVAIVGIGQIDMSSTTAQAGALGTEDIEKLKAAGAVASVCTSYINDRGGLVETDLNKRSIGQTLDKIKKCRTIALAIGSSKVEAIKAVLLGGYVDVFITDLETARAIIGEA
ncbi:MAG TPA: sugar-binding transcriptional regulator [Clostridia bacterium]|nr:sugar-binding transcriptional regulator [Clostridia bacterium]